MSPVPFARRDRLTSEVGPERIGSNPGYACIQMPERSGKDLSLSLAAPNTGVTATAANTKTRGKFPRCESMAAPPAAETSRRNFGHRLHPAHRSLKMMESDRAAIFAAEALLITP